MSFGITGEGFLPKSLDEIKADLESAFRAKFGESIDVSPQSNFGQLIGIIAERFADLWALGNGVYAAGVPDSAVGASLDYLAGLTGTVREAATNSEGFVYATGTPSTVLPIGRQVSVETIETKFETTEAATITAVTAWATGTVYAAGAVKTNDSLVLYCTTGGTSAGVGSGPTGDQGDSVTDNTVIWLVLGDGTGAVLVPVQSVDTGPKVAAAGTLNVIDTPVAGWSSAYNVEDAEVGSDIETDAALRLRREDELRATGKATVEAIRAALLKTEDVESATVFENPTDTTDGDGLPPHSVECVVLGGDDAAVAETIFENVAAGIKTFGQGTGAVSETVTDSQGVDHTIDFSRLEEIDIWVRVDVVKDPNTFPSDGEAQIKAAIVAYGELQRAGKNVVSAAVGAQAFTVSGVLDTPIVYIRTSSPAIVSTTIAISLRQLAVFDTGRITVNLSNGTP